MIIVDLVALLLFVTGFHMAFRQRLVRGAWARWMDTPPPPPRGKGEDADPAYYALIIFGVMVMAFGTILFFFTTVYSLLAGPPGP
ncbi:MAG TPA: hypothetical protein VI381_07080 [Allosphingosinicella sp.]